MTIHDIRPRPTDRKQHEPYYVALCSCNRLFPQPVDEEAEAREVAAEHVEKMGGSVEAELFRPVG